MGRYQARVGRRWTDALRDRPSRPGVEGGWLRALANLQLSLVSAKDHPPQPHREGTGKMDPQEQTALEHGWWEIARLFHEAAKILSSPPTNVSQGKVVTSLNHDSGATVTHNCWLFEASRGLKEHYAVITGVCLCHKHHQDMKRENPQY